MSANPPSPPLCPKRQRLQESEEEVNVGAGTSRQRPEAAEGSHSSEESVGQNQESTSSSGVSSILSFAPDLEEATGEECALDADVLTTFRQQKVTKCILENAVNRIVESYQFFVRPEDFLAPPESDGLEDAAILMAISEHGLSSAGLAPPGVAPAPPRNPTSVSEKEHLDFMEAAVAAAIQKKGLTPLSLPLSPHR
ncbi:uncharacterized protein LOC132264675 [Phlebotomus argentipes]|uniref:uncharacterized protein LOC132264675 n=1 Tax=Phlebotomus argentipes TaxID=94469 RepID=UPI002892FCB4|nr:uncharacterized protein LOC132264675 [Phlebotomus argentipes]